MTRTGPGADTVAIAAEPPAQDRLGSLEALLGAPRGRPVLDFGCADPAIAAHLARHGRYVGLADGESSRAAVLAELDGHPADVRTTDLDRWAGHDLGTFDVVYAGTPGHVGNLARVLETFHHHLVPAGRLVCALDHPLATAGTAGYFAEGPRPGHRRRGGRTAHHRRFETWIRELRYCGFQLTEAVEGPDGDDGAPWLAFRCVRTP
ncbi:class I SAM-dependent methyltransferase [Amycolatopsis sp. NPDC005003]